MSIAGGKDGWTVGVDLARGRYPAQHEMTVAAESSDCIEVERVIGTQVG
jgi:hypothetical protein